MVGIRQRFSADLGSLKCCEAREVRVKLREVAVKLAACRGFSAACQEFSAGSREVKQLHGNFTRGLFQLVT